MGFYFAKGGKITYPSMLPRYQLKLCEESTCQGCQGLTSLLVAYNLAVLLQMKVSIATLCRPM